MERGGIKKRKVRQINKTLEAKKHARKKKAAELRAKARKKAEGAKQMIADISARLAELRGSLEQAPEEEKPTIQKQIDELEKKLQQQGVEMKDAEAEERKYQQEEDDADKMDIDEEKEMEDDTDIDEEKEVEDDPDIPRDSIEKSSTTQSNPFDIPRGSIEKSSTTQSNRFDIPRDSIEKSSTTQSNPFDIPRDSIEKSSTTQSNPFDIAEAFRKGLRLSDPPEVLDLTAGIELRESQAIICHKNGFGKPAIVVDCEISDWYIYRIRKDVLIKDSCPNLMKWRRAGKVKGRGTEKKWSVDDISKIQGIAIEVPPGYPGKPEDLVELIPKLSGQQKDELKKEGKPIPKQPDVQLLIEWKEGMIAEDEVEERFTSWESRSGCRTLWKKHNIADAYLVRVAKQREINYRRAGGIHSSEERSVSPFEIPPAGSTPPPGTTPDPGRTPTPPLGDKPAGDKPVGDKPVGDKPVEDKPVEDKPVGDKPVGDKPVDAALAYKTGLKEFEPKFRMLEDIQEGVKLTAVQKGEMIEAFDAFWAKKQAT